MNRKRRIRFTLRHTRGTSPFVFIAIGLSLWISRFRSAGSSRAVLMKVKIVQLIFFSDRISLCGGFSQQISAGNQCARDKITSGGKPLSRIVLPVKFVDDVEGKNTAA